MNISISTAFNYGIPLKDQLPMIKNAGFTHISFGSKTPHSNNLSAAGQAELRRMLSDTGLEVCSIHNPIRKETEISSPQEETAAAGLDLLKRCIDAAVSLNARTVIFHATASRPDDPETDRRKEIFVEQVHRMLGHVGDQPAQLGVENLSYVPANEISAHSMDEIDHPKYGFCYDSSHANLTPPLTAMLKRYGDRLMTTHISDNWGEKDDHLLPWEGDIAWDALCRALSEIPFRGVFLMEPTMAGSSFQEPDEFLREAFTRAQKLLTESGKADRSG